jgi:hypothetical protein
MATIGGRVIVVGGKGGFGEKVNKRTVVNVLDTSELLSLFPPQSSGTHRTLRECY